MERIINPRQLIYPLFIREEKGPPVPIASLPGVFKYDLESLAKAMEERRDLGLTNILIFGIPEQKTWRGEGTGLPNTFLTRAIQCIKQNYPDFSVFSDICLCAYTKHGHCGVVSAQQSTVHGPEKKKHQKDFIDKEATLEALSEMALAHAKAGADYVAPSAMAEGQVAAIRRKLDRAGYKKVKIMGYSAKFASNFYGPFRTVFDSAPRFSDRSSYQLNYYNRQSALDAIQDDVAQGADIVMVKPALSYLDIIQAAKQLTRVPLAAYNVSGEYALAKLGAKNNLWKESDFVREVMVSIRRAGADYIITYHAADIVRWQKQYETRTHTVKECSVV